MDNGTVDAGSAATLALLADTARAGRGGYYGGEGGMYGGPFASPSANAVRSDRNAQIVEDQSDCTRAVLGAQQAANTAALENLERANSFNRICDKIGEADSRLSNQIFQQELRNGDRLRDIEREMNANQRETSKNFCDLEKEVLKCCCDTQKLVVSENAATRDLVNENTIRSAVDQNNINATVGPIVSAINAMAANMRPGPPGQG